MHEHLHSFDKLELEKVLHQIQSYAYSDLGREHLRVLRPASDAGIIRGQLDLVSEMKLLLEGDDALPLYGILDIREAVQRASIEDYVLQADDLRSISRTLHGALAVANYFLRRKGRYPLIEGSLAEFRVDPLLEHHISQAIDEDGRVKDAASKELQAIRRQIQDHHDTLRKQLERILRSLAGKEWAQEEIITTREGRMVIPIKVEYKNQIPGFIHSSSASGATVFVEPTETLELNNEIRTLQFKEQREIERILRALTAEIRAARVQILLNVRILGELDFIAAKAKYSIVVIGSAPRIGLAGGVRLLEAYHPLLLQKHKRGEITPLSLELSAEHRTLIITGPNAGGKSVAMKTAGLLCLLAQSGCHIPASPESELPICTDIFVDMGDEQSIENDLSSFSSHLRNLKLICDEVNPTSLVLIDEIASGTDPQEGAALASAILERLTASGCLTIVTTHHGMLKTFAFENPAILNGGMEFDQKALTPTYRFRSGIPGSSYALEMAERMELPKELIERSRELKGRETTKLEDLLLDLETQSQELRAAIERNQAETAVSKRLKEEYEFKLKSVQKELRDVKSQALLEGKRIIEEANTLVERTILQIRESGASKDAVRLARKELVERHADYAENERSLAEPASGAASRPIALGDRVRIKSTDSRGEVLARVDEKTLLVVMGNVKVKVAVQDLELTSEKEEKILRHNQMPEVTNVQRELDLRGLFGEEAITQVEKFLDSAMLSGLSRVDIIHGKGTGALRKRVTEYLKRNSQVKSYRLGEWNEGGGGVTVVEL